ncbi:MAG TPA: hypothetical protein VFC68_04955 [Treponemataceae bacterium]|nr:hypothetical protein [Treponemataceae bacterium]
MIKNFNYASSYIHTVSIKKATNLNWQNHMPPVIYVFAIVSVFLIFPGSILINNSSLLVKSKDLYIPKPSQYTCKAGFEMESYQNALNTLKNTDYTLPGLIDFIAVAWHMETAPYTRLSLDMQAEKALPLPEAYVDMPHFRLADTAITTESLYRKVFNSNYLSKQLRTIHNNSVDPHYSGGAEILLYSEGSFVFGTWNNLNTISMDFKGLIFSVTILLLSVYLTFYFASNRKKVRIL